MRERPPVPPLPNENTPGGNALFMRAIRRALVTPASEIPHHDPKPRAAKTSKVKAPAKAKPIPTRKRRAD